MAHIHANDKWVVHAFRPRRGASVSFGYATKAEAEAKAKELRDRGYENVEIVEN